MKYFNITLFFFTSLCFYGQDEPQFTIKGAKKAEDLGYVSKRRAVDCNKDLEWERGSTVVFHKKSRKTLYRYLRFLL